MIQYNLKEKPIFSKHPDDGKYGIIDKGFYKNYPLTIVDNINSESTLCLLHLSQDVRQYMKLRLFDEFFYMTFAFGKPTYRMYDYPFEQLNNDKIIEILKNVFYFLQPYLQNRSMVASSSDELEKDLNYYTGHYVLNDEEQYTILKFKTTYKFFKGEKKFSSDWKDTKDLIYQGEIDFDVYKLSLEVADVKRRILGQTNQILDEENEDIIMHYKNLLIELQQKVKSLI